MDNLDWLIVGLYFAVVLAIGLAVSRRAGRDTAQYFLSGRNMPWWLLGISMVATTFSADTPNLVTELVRTGGVAGNWVWWAYLLTGMLTVFVYAKLWRRAGIMTDLEFYEIRYGGKAAAFLRGFRALYLGVIFNAVVMATVTLAITKLAGVLLGISPFQTVVLAGGATLIFSALGGFRGVVLTDLLLFIFSMVGAVAVAIVAVNVAGDHAGISGLSEMLAHENVADRINLLPDPTDPNLLVPLLIIPLAVQWWATWYPGSEPGGGGYIAQRMLAARSETDSIGATFFFNAAHYALRPWPWIIVALASLIVFPDINAIEQAFPEIDEEHIGHDTAYPAMLTFLPTGLLGIAVASLFAAYIGSSSLKLIDF